MSYSKKKKVFFKKQTMKRRKQMKQKKQKKQMKQMKQMKQKNIKLLIKDLGKKTKNYKRLQYGCKKTMKGGGPLLQPFTYIGQQAENSIMSGYNTFYGYNDQGNIIY